MMDCVVVVGLLDEVAGIAVVVRPIDVVFGSLDIVAGIAVVVRPIGVVFVLVDIGIAVVVICGDVVFVIVAGDIEAEVGAELLDNWVAIVDDVLPIAVVTTTPQLSSPQIAEQQTVVDRLKW